MRLLTSAAVFFGLISLLLADGFGRFGYIERPELPGFKLELDGFTSKSANAEKLTFGSPARQWKPAATNEFGQTILLNAQALGPQKLRYSLWQAGFSLYFEKGMQLNLRSTGCPYITWQDGTVADGIATPDTTWALVSFRTAQPPILLVLESGQANFRFTGKAGNWSLKTETPFSGWIRVIQPIGTSEVAANSAAALGKLTKKVFENISIWTQPAPVFQGLTVKGDATAVEAVWTFDRPGAIVPLGAALSPVGGYQIKIQSPVRRLSDWNDEGPVAVCEQPYLKVRFPVRRIPLGRSLTEGKRPLDPIGTVSPIDIPSVVELALENLLADRDLKTLQAAEDVLSTYLAEAQYTPEPVTGQQFPFSANGTGIDLAACHALLMQATTISSQSNSIGNALLTSLSWRQDAYTWKLPAADLLAARRAAALAAISGFLCPEPERRLQGAMFEAGLAAERGLAVLRSRRAGQPEPKFSEPVDGLRRYAFFRDIKVSDEDPFAKSILSEVRVFGETPVSASKQGEALVVQWEAKDTSAHQIVFASAYPLDFELGNMNKLDVERALGLTQVRFVANQPGPCQANLRRPDWAKDLPTAVAVARYTEAAK